MLQSHESSLFVLVKSEGEPAVTTIKYSQVFKGSAGRFRLLDSRGSPCGRSEMCHGVTRPPSGYMECLSGSLFRARFYIITSLKVMTANVPDPGNQLSYKVP